MRGRFEVRLESPTDVSRIFRSGYTLILLDSCFIVEYVEVIGRLASDEVVKSSSRISAACGFTKHEVKSLDPRRTGVNAWRTLKKAESLNLCILKTGFIDRGEPTKKLHSFTEYVKQFKKSYAGWKSSSNIEDLALYVTTLYLRDRDVEVEVATLDRIFRKALEDAGISVHTRPWSTI